MFTTQETGEVFHSVMLCSEHQYNQLSNGSDSQYVVATLRSEIAVCCEPVTLEAEQ